jgi:hypothetical protein
MTSCSQAHGVPLHVLTGSERPELVRAVKLPAGDGPRIDQEPRLTVGQPGFRVMALDEVA